MTGECRNKDFTISTTSFLTHVLRLRVILLKQEELLHCPFLITFNMGNDGLLYFELQLILELKNYTYEGIELQFPYVLII